MRAESVPPSRVRARPVLVANWKLHGDGVHVNHWIETLSKLDLIGSGRLEAIVCPPAIWLERARAHLHGDRLALGIQDVSAYAEGAFTGEISAAMAAEAGARYALVGHSERRRLFGETDAVVVAKASQAVHAGLVPILCVGETAEERQGDKTEAVLTRQLAGCASWRTDPMAPLWIAYEPVWSIGTGHAATAEHIRAAAQIIRTHLAASDATMVDRIRLLYGGSVGTGNAAALSAIAGIDGLLVGGASVQVESMIALCRAVTGEESPS